MGLLRTASRAAVASSVHGRVQRRQQERWATQGATAPAPSAQPAPVAAAPPAAADVGAQLEQLKQLGELRDAGVLTDAEFEVKKAQILLA